MSADAKVWRDERDDRLWQGICDAEPEGHFIGTLSQVLTDIESFHLHPLRWEPRVYPDSKFGLRGFVA